MERIGIIANPNKPKAKETLRKLTAYLKKKKKSIFLDKVSAKLIKLNQYAVKNNRVYTTCSVVIALGGDGTLLRAAKILKGAQVPILGVNLGSLGFLTEVTLGELYKTLSDVFGDKYRLEERICLEATLYRRKKKLVTSFALNDCVITRGTLSRLIRLDTFIEKEYLTTYAADGLIVSTSTGSTAHSLSAGGPIVHPNIPAIILTPICPHTLSNRPLIISGEETISIEIASSHPDIALTLDGQEVISLKEKDVIQIKKASFKVRLIVPKKKSYYQILRKKLKWGGNHLIG
jgi:NAD+ kinase